MEESPVASTPMLETLSSHGPSGEVRSTKVPSPPVESELTRSEESIIDPPVHDGDDEMSIDRDASVAVQVGSMVIETDPMMVKRPNYLLLK